MARVVRLSHEPMFVHILECRAAKDRADVLQNHVTALAVKSVTEHSCRRCDVFTDRDRVRVVWVYDAREGWDAHARTPWARKFANEVKGCYRGELKGTFYITCFPLLPEAWSLPEYIRSGGGDGLALTEVCSCMLTVTAKPGRDLAAIVDAATRKGTAALATKALLRYDVYQDVDPVSLGLEAKSSTDSGQHAARDAKVVIMMVAANQRDMVAHYDSDTNRRWLKSLDAHALKMSMRRSPSHITAARVR